MQRPQRLPRRLRHRPGPRQLRALPVQVDRRHTRPAARAQGGAVAGAGEGVGGVKESPVTACNSVPTPATIFMFDVPIWGHELLVH